MNIKQILGNSLEELMLEKPIDEVHVAEILNRSGLSRPTFYRHFNDKYDLLTWYYNNMLKATVYPVKDGMSYSEAMLNLFNVFETKLKFLQNGFRSRDINGLHNFNIIISKKIMTSALEAKGVDMANPFMSFMLDIYVQGSTDVLCSWIMNGMKTPKQDMVAVFKRSWPGELAMYID